MKEILLQFFNGQNELKRASVDYIKELLGVFENEFEGRFYAWSLLFTWDKDHFKMKMIDLNIYPPDHLLCELYNQPGPKDENSIFGLKNLITLIEELPIEP